MVAKKDAQFQSSVTGIRSSFEETIVLSTDFSFHFITLLENCTEFFVEYFLAACGFV